MHDVLFVFAGAACQGRNLQAQSVGNARNRHLASIPGIMAVCAGSAARKLKHECFPFDIAQIQLIAAGLTMQVCLDIHGVEQWSLSHAGLAPQMQSALEVPC